MFLFLRIINTIFKQLNKSISLCQTPAIQEASNCFRRLADAHLDFMNSLTVCILGLMNARAHTLSTQSSTHLYWCARVKLVTSKLLISLFKLFNFLEDDCPHLSGCNVIPTVKRLNFTTLTVNPFYLNVGFIWIIGFIDENNVSRINETYNL